VSIDLIINKQALRCKHSVEFCLNLGVLLFYFLTDTDFYSLVMKTPDCVIWALTKRNNSQLVKFNGNEWTHNPLSLTGFHNASSSSSTIGVGAHHKKSKKNFRRVFSLTLKHKLSHGLKTAKSANSQSHISTSQINLTKDVNRAAKVI